MKNKNQSGFSLIELFIVIFAVGALLVVWNDYEVNTRQPKKHAKHVIQDMRDIQLASTRYFLDAQGPGGERVWPSTIDDLIDYYDVENRRDNVFGYEYLLDSSEGNTLVIETELPGVRVTNLVHSGLFGSMIIGDSSVGLRLARPSHASIQNYFLARREVPGCDDCNTLAVDLDLGEHDIENIGQLNAQTIDVGEATIEDLNVQRIATESVILGSNSITYSGNQIRFNANETHFSGDLSASQGDFQSLAVSGNVSGGEFTGTDFVTEHTSTNTNRELLDDLLEQWESCVNEGGCQ